MDKTNGNSSEKGQEHENRQRMIDAMIPAGLTGQIRDKARDALMTATVILGMSRTDILDHIQELAKENGLTPQSARVWMLFVKEMQDKAQAVGREVGDKGSRSTFSNGLGYSKGDTRTIGLGAVFTREVTGTGIGKSAKGDMRKELNDEAGHHMNSIQGRHGVFSYDQMVDGWGTGGDGQGLDAIGLDGQDGDTSLDMEIDGDFGSDGAQIDPDAHERLPGDSVMTPGDLGETQLAEGVHRGRSGYEIDHQDTFQASKGGLSGGWFKNASRSNSCKTAIERAVADAGVAGLNRKTGGFRGTDAEFAAFAKANPNLDKNQLRLLRKGMTDKDYLSFRVYVDNGHLLDNKGRGGDRIATQTRACLLLVSEASARGVQNVMRTKARLFSRLPDPGMAGISIDQAVRMAKPLTRLTEEFAVKNPKKVKKYEESVRLDNEHAQRDAKKKHEEPGLER
ncbi:hypothetical protein BBC27_09645 [Acidithiobacillus ferrivorans]|uniref:Uncharacterized protein n=1 Tax=Acidithiobacillus ferrivorans TaxID=160808 RepID=A0A1B9BZF9_9PROT|nr:hypothetical protein [Acidithiobacillus ferrivorans]OCB03102.1 hypothetical protein BBC27_09645 [Acidithiobacillus ferrivorans]